MIAKEDEAARESVNERRFTEGMERAREMEETAEYAAFVEKFVPKKTTDECYTPELVYEAVRGWAVERYDLQGREIVRPFYPGGDYEHAEYPEGCVVIDNPPFSIISKICAYYQKKGNCILPVCTGKNAVFGGERETQVRVLRRENHV